MSMNMKLMTMNKFMNMNHMTMNGYEQYEANFIGCMTFHKYRWFCIFYTRQNINKWKKLVNIGKSEKYIKFDNDLCVIQDRGIINIKGVIPFNDRWIRTPKTSLTLKCNLEILNLVKSRTGGRAGGIKS